MTRKKPNIVLLTVDCFRYDRCGFNGYHKNTTPFLDSLAIDSVVFDNAYATGPYTPQSFPGLLAGLHSNSLCYRGDIVCKAIPPDQPTIATYLKGLGYSTFATITNTHLSEDRNFDRGFDYFDNIRLHDSKQMTERRNPEGGSTYAYYKRIFRYLKNKIGSQDRRFNLTIPIVIAYRYAMLRDWPTVPGSAVVDEFSSVLSNENISSQPFFGWLHLMDLHAPLHPDKTKNAAQSSPGGRIQQFVSDAYRISDIQHSQYDMRYDAMLEYIDAQIKKTVDVLRSKGVWDNTILILTGDHGELLGDRGIYGHPHNYLYDELLKVPLIVSTPNKKHKRVDDNFSLAWIHELISELIDENSSSLPATTERQSHLIGSSSSGNDLVISDTVNGDGYSISIRDGNKKYIHHNLSNDIEYIERKQSLYRINQDPGEHTPLNIETIPEKFIQAVERYHIEPNNVPAMGNSLNQQTEKRLRQLGYIE